MKILLYGGYDGICNCPHLKKHFEGLGHTVVPFRCHTYHSALFRSIERKLPRYLSWIFQAFINPNYILNLQFRLKALKERPDLILVIQGEFLFRSTLDYIRKKLPGTVMMNWMGDSPFVLWNSSVDLVESLSAYDVDLFVAKYILPTFISVGARRAEYLPVAYEPGFLNPDIRMTKKEISRYSSEVLFVGAWWPDREMYLSQLTGFDLKVWGPHWKNKVRRSSPLYRHIMGGPIYGDQLSKAFRSSKIILNFLREQGLDGSNMRTFEVTGFGEFLLTQRTKEQCQELFTEGRDLAAFSDLQELKKKISYYLENKKERQAIARSGRGQTLKRHTYLKRAEKLLSIYWEERARKETEEKGAVRENS